MRRGVWVLGLLLPIAAHAQYVGKVQTGPKQPTLRATAVYEYTGDPKKPNASRLVPVVVWDGDSFQPGGLYLAQPDPLTVAPGTEYILQRSGDVSGYFDVRASGTLNGGWVGMGIYRAEAPVPPASKLSAMKNLPKLEGGRSRGRIDVDDDEDGPPVLHRHAGSEEGSTNNTESSSGATKPDSSRDSGPVLHRKDNSGASTSTGSSTANDDRPTLHRRDDSGTGSSQTSTSASAPDPDRPKLHAPESAKPAPDADRPHLHRASGSGAAPSMEAPDPDRPHLRYGRPDAEIALGTPTELKDVAVSGMAGGVPVGQMVAISDVAPEPPHSFHYAWSNADAETQARDAMHALAVHALASETKASFGPAASSDAALKQADEAEQANFGPAAHATFGPAAQARAARKKGVAASAAPDPLQDVQFSAFSLSYDGAVAYVFSAHTAVDGGARRYVTIMAQPDFSGNPHLVFTQTTRGDTLNQTPALHLIDAVDADGDHRAELLFDEQSSLQPAVGAGRQFALFRVLGGQAELLYRTNPSVAQ